MLRVKAVAKAPAATMTPTRRPRPLGIPSVQDHQTIPPHVEPDAPQDRRQATHAQDRITSS